MRLAALMLAAWLTAGAMAQAEMPRPFAWLQGKQHSETKTAKGSGVKMPAVMTKMAGAPKRLVTGTKNLLTPKKEAKAAPKKLGTIAVHKNHPEPEQPGFFARLFGEDQHTEPATVGEWMQLEQVKPFGGSKPIR